MTSLVSNARVFEIDGPFYDVQLSHIPRQGELIKLYSRDDAHTGHNPFRRYVVVQIVHEVTDVTDKTPRGPLQGSHSIEVYVKPTESEFFED